MSRPPELTKACPFCGDAEGSGYDIRENTVWNGGTRPSTLVSVEVLHWCPPVEGQPNRAIVRVGRDRQSAFAAWNSRTFVEEVPATRKKSVRCEECKDRDVPSYFGPRKKRRKV